MGGWGRGRGPDITTTRRRWSCVLVGMRAKSVVLFLIQLLPAATLRTQHTSFCPSLLLFIFFFYFVAPAKCGLLPAPPSQKKSPCENLANRLRTERKTRRKKERQLLFSSLFLFSSFFSQAFAFKAACGGGADWGGGERDLMVGW